jgi:O-antigen/teichoic acid export membrane protein
MSNLVISKGKSGINFWVTISLGLAQIITMALIWPYGIHTMVVSYVGLNLLWLFIWHFFTSKLIYYNIFLFLKDIMPFALSATVVMIITYYLTRNIENLYILLGARILIAALLYFAVMKIARVKILDECLSFVHSKFTKL